jgi:hypothetical protein
VQSTWYFNASHFSQCILAYLESLEEDPKYCE